MLLFNKQNDFYLMQFIHETFTFRIGFDPIFGTTMFSCHVLIFIFGLFILFVRYKMSFSNMGNQLISEVVNIPNKDNCLILKHCDPITMKNLNKIKHIGELFMYYGPIIYGSVFLAYFLAFMYLLYVFPQSNILIIMIDSMFLTIETITVRAIISSSNCIAFFYMIELTYFHYRFNYWNKLLNRIQQRRNINFISTKSCRLLLHSFLHNHNSMIIWIMDTNKRLSFLFGYSSLFLFPIHIIMLDLLLFHYSQFSLPNIALIIIYVFNITLLVPIVVGWLPIRLHSNIFRMHQQLYSLLITPL
uniref:Uncharacterized protein LOC113789751 n=1 Tax=Dermatophagoides pteronyssinus TaxID=6956 RepID=A0A6P6XQR6_DERPT|nr:uncharacterized protein LOC113789751 [Dermatophagoides pteronyssinus]